MPIKIDFLANVRDFVRGTGDAEEALDDVADSLDDMAADAKKGGRDAERSIQRLESGFRDAARRARDLGDAGKDAGKDVERGMDRAEEGIDEFKDEANSTAREAAASFDGSAESIGDAFQEIAANAFAGFGPAGAVAGLAAAAGIGLAVAGFEDVNEAEKASEQRAAEWADAYVDAGGRILSATQIVEKVRAIITDPEQYKKATENAKNWGVEESVALLAMAGDTNALTEARDSLTKAGERAAKIDISEADKGGKQLADLEQKIRNGSVALDELTTEMEQGWQKADAYSTSLRLLAEHTEGATAKVDEFGDTVVTLPDGKTIYIDAETGQATDDTQKLEQKIYGIRNKDVNITARTTVDRAAYDAFVRELQNRTFKIKGRVVTTGDPMWD